MKTLYTTILNTPVMDRKNRTPKGLKARFLRLMGTFLAIVLTGSFLSGQGVNLVLQDAPSGTLDVGNSFTLTVQVANAGASAQEIDGVEVHLDFNPAVLNVTAVQNLSSATLGSILIDAQFSNASGTVDFAAGTLNSTPAAPLDILAVTFEAVGQGVSPISFTTTSPRISEVTFAGSSVLDQSTGASVSVGSSGGGDNGTFLLIDAGTDQAIATLTPGLVLDWASLPANNMNIAFVPVSSVGSVVLEISGPINSDRTESTAPYALFGDSGGNYKGEDFPQGTYTVTATPYSGSGGSGTAGTTVSVTFQLADEAPCNGAGFTTYYADADGDGFGDAGDTQQACSAPPGYVANDEDCDDSDDSIYPGAPDAPNDGIDSDCDGTVEVVDNDNDGFGSDVDCNDNNPAINPGATEVCDGVDNDCDGQIDEGFDADGDGFTTCEGDCDDGDDSVYPGAPEVCDGKDNDCDGQTDENNVCNPQEGTFLLIDAGTDQAIATLTAGLTLNLSSLPANNMNIAFVPVSAVGSVVLTISGPVNNTRTESAAPYALFGDSGGNYYGQNFPAGNYTVTATPYSGSGGSGTAGTTVSVSFQLVDGASLNAAPATAAQRLAPETAPGLKKQPTGSSGRIAPRTTASGQPLELTLYPNPVSRDLTVQLPAGLPEEAELLIFDLSGRPVFRTKIDAGTGKTVIGLNDYQLSDGIYLLQLRSEKEIVTKRFVKQKGMR